MEGFEDRFWLSSDPRAPEGLRFLSYRLTTREELRTMRHTSMDYDLLRRNAWAELLVCDADIIALQNIDETELWRVELAAKGYDVVVGERTQRRFTGSEANIIGTCLDSVRLPSSSRSLQASEVAGISVRGHRAERRCALLL